MKTILLLLFCTLLISCNEENIELKQTEGIIVGFDPCTIRHHYRIGYVIISTDMKDTLVTYNLSDTAFKMPASVLVNLSDTLYKIPESYFQNYFNSAYFPGAISDDYEVKFTYTEARENEKVIHECATDFNNGDFSRQILNNQVIIKSATKP